MSKKNNNLSDVEFSAIQYSLLVNGDAHITTSFVFPDLLVVIKSNEGSLFVYEHLIIQNITELYIATKEE